MEPKYKRVVIKMSGEALAGTKSMGIDVPTVTSIASQVKTVNQMGVEVAIVVGGGNFFRGRDAGDMDRTSADHMGMLATVMNSLALQDAIEKQGVAVRVQSAIEMRAVCEPYIRRKAVRHLEKGRVVIFAAGIGSPFFSTDTAAALRAAEIDAQAIISAKNIDGVYDSDPAKNKNAKKFDSLSHFDVIDKGLKVIDSTAATLSMDNQIPILIFSIKEENSIVKVICGEKIGTIIH